MKHTLLNKHVLDRQTSIYKLLIFLTFMFFLTLSYFLTDLIQPLLLALFVAYALNPIVTWLENRRVPSILANSIPIVLIVGLLWLVGYFFYLNTMNFIEHNWDTYTNRFTVLYHSIIEELKRLNLIRNTGPEEFDFTQIISNSQSFILGILGQTTYLGFQAFLFTFYLLFLLPGIKNFKVKVYRIFDKSKALAITRINEKILNQIQQYILQKVLVSLGTAIAVYISCLIFGTDLALVWAVMTFVLNFIPNIGSTIAMALPMLLSLIQFDPDYTKWVLFSLSLIVIQTLFGYIVEPRLYSSKFSISKLLVIFSLVIFGFLWGAVGVILSVPILVIITIICSHFPSLKPIVNFIQGSFPLNDDIERLSLIAHVVHCDKKFAEKEKEFVDSELRKEVYNQKIVDRVWKKVQRKPLPIDKVFRDKDSMEGIDLYYLSCRLIALDNEFSKEETVLLNQIQTECDPAKSSAVAIHQLIKKEKSLDWEFSLSDTLTDRDKEEQIAYSYVLIAKRYFELELYEEAKAYYLKALHLYVVIDDQNSSMVCSSALSVIESLNEK